MLASAALLTTIVMEVVKKDHPRGRSLQKLTSAMALLTLFAAGGARHHFTQQIRIADDISRFTGLQPELARVKGVVAGPIEIREAKFGPRIPPWMEVDRSTCLLQAESIEQYGKWIPCSGTVRTSVSGHLVHVRTGDRIEVIGSLEEARPPDNPGGMDYKGFLQRQGISSLLQVEHPAAVNRLHAASGVSWTLARWRESIRKECQLIFMRTLPGEQAGLASSLLIGERMSLTDDLEEKFIQTGTMHLLAISGLHVGILLGLILKLCRLWNLGSTATGIVLVVTIIAYLFITDLRPPVLRAGILAVIAVLGIFFGARTDRMNALATCALILMIWRPADIFDIGAQLSFLAVAAILWSLTWSKRSASTEKTLAQILNEDAWWYRWWKPVRKYLVDVYKMTAAVMLATLPITMATFHLVAPVGILLNMVLIPYIAIVLGLGYLLMFCGLLLPISAGMIAVPFQWSLQILQTSVTWGQSIPLGHFYLPHLPLWWLIVFYLWLAVAWRLIGSAQTARWGLRGMLCWCILGLLWPFIPAQREGLRCTFLSVGHGLATLIEFPGGEVMLYDAGTIGDGERATRAITNAIWSRGIQRIDAVVISHADHDHFSGMFGLLEKIPVSSIFVTRQFLDFQQQGVADLCEMAAAHGIPIQLIHAGDSLKLRQNRSMITSMEVLYPPSETAARSDNANSLVLAVTHANRRILLTGDLEKEGLQDVLAMQPIKTDLLLSPHHGGRVANVLNLYEWASPRYAVVSSREQILPALASIPNGCTLLNTACAGATTVEIHNNGALSIQEYVTGRIHKHARDSD